MALAQIIDLEERRRARAPLSQATPVAMPMWCYLWMPVYVWYVA